MSDQQSGRIVRRLMDEPHVAGRRISVMQIHDSVEGKGLSPRTVADRYDLDVADVYRALAYFHEHPGEMQQVRERRERSREDAERRARERRPEGVTPPSDDG